MTHTTTGSLSRKNRQDQAIVRQNARSERTAKQQLKVLDARLGTGQGAARERQVLGN